MGESEAIARAGERPNTAATLARDLRALVDFAVHWMRDNRGR